MSMKDFTHVTRHTSSPGRPDPFSLHRQPSSLNLFCQLQISLAIGDFLRKLSHKYMLHSLA